MAAMQALRALRCRACPSQSKHAPMDWLMELNRRPLIISFVVCGSVAFLLMVNALLQNQSTATQAAMGTDTIVCALTAFILKKRFRMPVAVEMGLAFMAFCVMVVMHVVSFIFVENDFIFRVRSAATTIIWKPMPAVFGFPVALSAVFQLWISVTDAFALLAMAWLYGDPNELRIHANNIILSVGWFAVSWMNSGRLRSIYDAQQAVAAEKELLEMIITMMCDAMVWLSSDESTVLRCDQRFQMIVGKEMSGLDLSEALGIGEQSRLQESLARARTAPVLIPTTLRTTTGTRVPVDMFIVGNREAADRAAGAKEPGPAFLLGIRINNHQDTEMFQGQELRQDAADALARGPEEPCRPDELMEKETLFSSVPETTATGLIFDRVDIDRWLANSAKRDEEVLKSLERIATLGQGERWLMSSRELTIEGTKILGAGSFGVVCAGRLHGSPIAIKTTRHVKDSASVEHLVAIANEIRILRHVRHPNIVLFHGACVELERGEVMLVLERVLGPDLQQYVAEHCSNAEVYCRFQLLLDVACALRYLHAQSPQVVHGDLKGTNILVEPAGPRAKLVDFGLSRLLTKGMRPLGGTLDWMAPEVIVQRDARPRASADVFSFGRLTYMVATCKKPLQNVRAGVVVEMAKNGAVPALQWQEERPLQAESKQLCQSMLDPTPEARPYMSQVHQEVSAWRLTDREAHMPALELVRAESKSENGAQGHASGEVGNTGGTTGGGMMNSLREVLNSAVNRYRKQPPASAAASGSGASSAAAGAAPACTTEVRTGGGSSSTDAPSDREALGPLVLSWRKATEDHIKKLMILDAVMQWNFRVPPGTCCGYHAGLKELGKIWEELTALDCTIDFKPHEQYQCSKCGVLDVGVAKNCPMCQKQTSWACSLSSIIESSRENLADDGSGQSPEGSARSLVDHVAPPRGVTSL